MSKSKLLNIGGQKDDQSYRYKMPSLIVRTEGRGNGIKTMLINIKEVSKALKVSPKYPTKFFGIEMGAISSSNDKQNIHTLTGAHSSAELQKKLEKFISLYILCDKCNLPEAVWIAKSKRKPEKACNACGFKSPMSPAHKLTTFIEKHPPAKKRSKKKSTKTSASTSSARKEKHSLNTKKSDGKRDSLDSNGNPMNTSCEEWTLDMSEMAIQQREEMENSKNKRGDGKKFQGSAKNSKSRSILSELLESNASVSECMAEIGRLEIAGSKTGRRKFLLAKALINDLFGGGKSLKEMKQVVEKHSDFLFAFMQSDERHFGAFMAAFEEFFKNSVELVPILLERLYDCGVVEEENLIKWYYEEKEVKNKALKEVCAGFIEWLENAEEESD